MLYNAFWTWLGQPKNDAILTLGNSTQQRSSVRQFLDQTQLHVLKVLSISYSNSSKAHDVTHLKHIGVYRYTSAYTGIPCVYRYTVRIPVSWYTGIPSSYFTDIFMDFSEFTTNFRRFLTDFIRFLADFVICSQILPNFRQKNFNPRVKSSSTNKLKL